MIQYNMEMISLKTLQILMLILRDILEKRRFILRVSIYQKKWFNNSFLGFIVDQSQYNTITNPIPNYNRNPYLN